LKIDPASVQD